MHDNPGDVRQSVLGSESSGLTGTGRFADELYLIAHHEITGKPYLSPRPLGIGLAGGLLAELMTTNRPAVTLDRGYLLPLHHQNAGRAARYARPDEPVAGHALDLIMAESPPRQARDWLLFLGRTSAAEIAGRLERSGYLIRPPGGIPWRTPRPVPTDVSWSFCALLRAHAALDATKVLTTNSALLTGLTLAFGLGFRFSALSDGPARSAEEAKRVLSRPMQELIAHVQVTADNTVLSTRR